MSKVDEYAERLKAVLGAARDIAATAETENRDFTDAERTDINAKMAEAKDIKRELDKSNADQKLRETLAELGDDVQLNSSGKRAAPKEFRQTNGGKPLGQMFVESKEYADLLASAPGGAFTKQHRVVTRPVGVDSLLTRRNGGSKALLTSYSADLEGSIWVAPDFIGQQQGPDAFMRPLALRDLVTAGRTTSDSIEYVQITGFTNNAAPVPEATGTADALSVKPESGITASRLPAPVRTIAHWIPITKRALADAAQVRTLIDGFLSYGVEEELEDQMLSGDGTGENFTGLLNTSGIQGQAYDTSALVSLRRAKTKVRVVGRSTPTGYVLNPADVEALDLTTNGNGDFYFGGPAGTGAQVPTLWNLPLIESEAVPAGRAIVGDWRKAILWDREQASITMTDSHADFFVRNLVAVLGEMRAAFGVVQPSAFVSIDLTP